MLGSIQIQSFVELAEPRDLSNALETYRQLLWQIGYRDSQTAAWLSHISWSELLTEGLQLVHSWDTITAVGNELSVAPAINGFSRATLNKLNRPLLELELLLDPNQLVDDSSLNRYKGNVGPALWCLVRQFYEAFRSSGAYLGDVTGRGEQWFALLADGTQQWSFDLGIVPHNLLTLFSSKPIDFLRRDFVFGLAFLRLTHWRDIPWAGMESVS